MVKKEMDDGTVKYFKPLWTGGLVHVVTDR